MPEHVHAGVTLQNGTTIVSVDRRSIACEVHPHGRIDYAVILTQGHDGSLRAYRGIGSDGFVLEHGDPLRVDEARAHFRFADETEWKRYRS